MKIIGGVINRVVLDVLKKIAVNIFFPKLVKILVNN